MTCVLSLFALCYHSSMWSYSLSNLNSEPWRVAYTVVTRSLLESDFVNRVLEVEFLYWQCFPAVAVRKLYVYVSYRGFFLTLIVWPEHRLESTWELSIIAMYLRAENAHWWSPSGLLQPLHGVGWRIDNVYSRWEQERYLDRTADYNIQENSHAVRRVGRPSGCLIADPKKCAFRSETLFCTHSHYRRLMLCTKSTRMCRSYFRDLI